MIVWHAKTSISTTIYKAGDDIGEDIYLHSIILTFRYIGYIDLK